MKANLIVALVKLASRVALNTVKFKQNSLRRTLKSLPLPPWETPNKYPHNDTLNEKCVVMKQLI